MKFEIIKDYGRISGLITASLRKGVRTNTAMTGEEYKREIKNGSLMTCVSDHGLFIMRRRESHIKLNYYINDTGSIFNPGVMVYEAERSGWSGAAALPLVVETAFRERDTALRETAAYFGKCGFATCLERVRLSRAADGSGTDGAFSLQTYTDDAQNRKADGVPGAGFCLRTANRGDADAVRRLLDDSFSRLTGCLPGDDVLSEDIEAGRFIILDAAEGCAGASSYCGAGTAAGLLHFTAAGRTAEIKHLALAASVRGKGLSASLITAFLSMNKGMKASVWTGSGNQPALAAYGDCGFRPDGRRSVVQIYEK